MATRSKTARESQVLSVYLGSTMVGTLTWLPNEQIIFAFAESYMLDRQRPTLSLSYKDALGELRTAVKPTSVRLPPFFSNLLPEGELRKYLAGKAQVKEAREFFLLNELREDLPGAVILHPTATVLPPAVEGSIENTDRLSEDVMRFSLAGIQLKFSGDLRGSKLVIPSRGIGGHWIVKLPSASFPNVNEVEYLLLEYAGKTGITVPEIKLIPLSQVQGLPDDVPYVLSGDCLLSCRFDRRESGERIHMEDFAQVFGRYNKYDPELNYQSIANVLFLEIGLEAVLEFVRRLVFMVATGNADMHLKNWALIYPDRIRPQLAPAYDFVSTIIYPIVDRRLALKLAGENQFNRISINGFRRFAAIARLPEGPIVNTVLETAEAINQSWPEFRERMQSLKSEFATRMDEHMKTISLLKK